MKKNHLYAENIKFLRNAYGETQEQLAEIVSVGATTISNYERGNRQPDLETAGRIAHHYNITLDQLFFEDQSTS